MISAQLREQVAQRAGNRCEYCGLPLWTQGATFHIDHVVPRDQGGATEKSNLALACPHCNLHKATRTSGADPESGNTVRLYNPRIHKWREHFGWSAEHSVEIVGKTPEGRATVTALQLNAASLLRARACLILLGIDLSCEG